ncbi:MAG TPA: glycosyltransferase family 2 protein [Pricia antarctica]|uniref:Glycosyltransferase family 2 protein n=1 Tax=Pricia antarctica TaxID=641691 RepID=A0A831VU25_9FLAO|nr:glycosyltransferase family 2 protein [Pricia antarctica]
MISICMAVYNGEKYLREQIDSILPQLGETDELIISDDGSTDNTLKILDAYNDLRIKVLKSNGRNIIKNFENALTHSSGEIIFLADQDDIWYPSKVPECLKYLRKYDLVFSNVEVFRDDIADMELFYSKKGTKTGILRNLIKNNYIGATMAFKRRILEKSLPFPRNIYMHDIWLAMTAEIVGKTFFIEKPLMGYRRHGENASQTGEKSSNTLIRKLKIRIDLVRNLIHRFS